MMMVEQIVSNNEHLSRALINRLNSFIIPMIPGENIEEAAAFIKTVCTHLDTCQKLPPDIELIVYNIMKTCTVDRFRMHMQTLESIESTKLRTYDGVLREAVRYKTLLHTGIDEWLPVTKSNSVYVGNDQAALPQGDPAVKVKATHNGKGNPIDRTAPGKNDPKSRDSKIVPGRKEYWCSSCDHWGSHDVDHHDAWKQCNKEYFNKERIAKGITAGNANCTAGTVTPPSTASTDDTSMVVSAPSLSYLVLATFQWSNDSNVAMLDGIWRLSIS
jgi:hypothetical protein